MRPLNKNPKPEGGWTGVSNLNFTQGDFIEVDMDLTPCRYVNLTGNTNKNLTDAQKKTLGNQDIGQDNIIGFSTDNFNTSGVKQDLKAITNSMQWYYPSTQYLIVYSDPSELGWIRSRVHAGKWGALENNEGLLDAMNLILDKDGILRDGVRWTGNPGDWSTRIKPALTSATTVYLGSVEGVHHSRAIYNFIRVVRILPENEYAVTPVPRD